MACKFVVFLGMAVLARAAVLPVVPAASVVQAAPVVPAVAANDDDFDPAPQYSFTYDVQDPVTGDSKAQYETRNGDVVQGSYSLIEADGTRRIVDYTADPINGFNAVVSREPAVAAFAAPAVGYAPAVGVAPAAAPEAAAPRIPSSGPDSEVEIIDSMSGPLRQANQAERQGEQSQKFQSQRIQGQQQNQRFQGQSQNQQFQGQSQNQQYQSQRQSEQFQSQKFARQPQVSSRAGVEPVVSTSEFRQATVAAPVRAVARPVAPAISAAFTANSVSYVAPAVPAARLTLTYPAYSAAYTASYASPLAYSAPIAGLTYAPTYL